MATLSLIRCARNLTVGLALFGAVLVGPPSLGAATASAAAGIAVEEPVSPPTPDPVPGLDAPVNAGPANQAPPVHHRRHHGDPVMGR